MSQTPPPGDFPPNNQTPNNQPPGNAPPGNQRPGNVPPGNVPPGGYPSNYGAPQPMSPDDEKLWSTLTHIGAIFFSFVVPLITYLVLRDRGPFVRAHTATALNFQLTALIAWVAILILTVVTFGFAGVLYFPLYILIIVFSIIAAVAANRGQFYKYPLSIQFVS